MSNLAQHLMESASAVAALAACPEDVARLDDASLVAGMALISSHKRDLQSYEVSIAAEIAKRSHHELGYDGLARRSGSATPAIFIQSITGTSMDEARRLAKLGESLMESTGTESAPPRPAPAAEAARDGRISVDAADAIRRGLGSPDAVVSAEQLAELSIALIAASDGMTPEDLWRAARLKRAALDAAWIERGEKERSDARYVRIWQKDGFCGGAWRLPEEDGGLEINNALKLHLARKTDGPRFAEKTPAPGVDNGSPADSDGAIDAQSTADSDSVVETAPAPEDPRPMEHILADGFATIFHNGLGVNPNIVPGAGRAAVRVIITEPALNTVLVGGVPDSGVENLALIEDTQAPLSTKKLTEYVCGGGIVAVGFDCNGDVVNIGREQRLFTARQRIALGARDGGCRFPGCNKPPSWTEAHHIEEWKKHNGSTDVRNGILLCRYHHMLIHNRGWEILRSGSGEFWLKPPAEYDPARRLIAMPSKNPIIAERQRARAGASTGSATG